RLIDNPSETFHKIKLAEHKNYILFLLSFLAIRFLIISRFISVPSSGNNTNYNLFLVILFSLIITYLLVLLLPFLIKKIASLIKIKVRYKDVLAVLTYSFTPNLCGLFILFPVELVFYGEYLFSNNPYPFQIKESVFYFLLVLEILTILWSVFLLIIGLNEFLKSKFLSLTISLIIWLMISVILYFQSIVFFIQ
ncbi:MAG: YIP1 family protein, partial [Ignavibacterium sp.]